MFIYVILTLFLLGDAWWAFTAWATLRRQTRAGHRASRVVLWGVSAFVLAMVGTLTAVIVARVMGAERVVPVWLLGTMFVWHLLVLPASLVAMLVFASGRTAIRLARGKSEKVRQAEQAMAEDVPAAAAAAQTIFTRRQLLVAAAVSAPPVATVLATGWSLPQLDNFRLRTLDVPVPGLPRDLDGITIAHLTDTHLGDFTPARLYNRLIDATNSLRADLIVHTGDIINVDSDDIPDAMKGLARLEAPLGVFACEGNHDLIQNPRRFRESIRALPSLRFLRGDAQDLMVRGVPVRILGLPWTQRGDPGADVARSDAYSAADRGIAASCERLAPADKAPFMLLLAHHPHAFDYAPYANLTLAGHTHGGQIMLAPGVGPGPLMYRYYSGIYRKPDRSLVVSNGAGNWFPLRTNAPAEILKLTLRSVAV